MSTVAVPRAGDRAYATLLAEIQDGTLAPGTVLGEVEQAARLGVSRTPMREAIKLLAADGLVVQQSPRVTVVSAVDAEDIRALFEIRRALEESAARLAAARGDREIFAALAADIGVVDLAADAGREEYYDLIARLDRAIDDAVANDYMASALRTVRAHLVRVRRMAKDKPERLAATVAEHALIATAIAEGDADLAAHATHVHLRNALAGILDSLGDGVSTRSASGRARSTGAAGVGEGVSTRAASGRARSTGAAGEGEGVSTRARSARPRSTNGSEEEGTT